MNVPVQRITPWTVPLLGALSLATFHQAAYALNERRLRRSCPGRDRWDSGKAFDGFCATNTYHVIRSRLIVRIAGNRLAL